MGESGLLSPPYAIISKIGNLRLWGYRQRLHMSLTGELVADNLEDCSLEHNVIYRSVGQIVLSMDMLQKSTSTCSY